MPPRVVLDTNVCLDLFVYRDTGCQALMRALQQGEVQAVTRADCRDEWLRVLDYPQFRVDAQQRVRVVAECDAWVRFLAPTSHSGDAIVLPRCADGDDQKFLELALESGANCLITKDRELLKLARKMRRLGLFAILSPKAWALDRVAA